MHDLKADVGLPSRPPGHLPVGGQPESCAERSSNPLEEAFESDLAAWLAWLEAARGTKADEHAMRRLEAVYGAGWIAVSAAGVAIPIVGGAAAVLCVAFLVGMLVLGLVVTAPEAGGPHTTGATAVKEWPEWSSLDPAERARLVRIVNLSRVVARPLGAKLLLSELDEALAAEPFASWLPLSELRDVVKAGGSPLVPFGLESCQGESAHLFAGHVP